MKGKFGVLKNSKVQKEFEQKRVIHTQIKNVPHRVEILRCGAAVTELTFIGDTVTTRRYSDYTAEA